MSVLINLKQRIKVVETIRKTTHAMRLISMSHNARLRTKKKVLEAYQKETERITNVILQKTKNNFLYQGIPKKKLLIIIGSQKGLCGNFNLNLIRFLSVHFPPEKRAEFHIMVLGKQIIGTLSLQGYKFHKSYDSLNQNNFIALAQNITREIFSEHFEQVIIISNRAETFFLQIPTQTILLPLSPQEFNTSIQSNQEYAWEADPIIILDHLLELHVQANLQLILFQSLLAEQAARFISMDAATHNAENLLNTMKLDYNKLRQAMITRELTDLIGGIL